MLIITLVYFSYKRGVEYLKSRYLTGDEESAVDGFKNNLVAEFEQEIRDNKIVLSKNPIIRIIQTIKHAIRLSKDFVE
jgi:hypothetical protein